MDFLELLSGSNPFLSKCLRVVVGFKQLEVIGYRGSQGPKPFGKGLPHSHGPASLGGCSSSRCTNSGLIFA